MTRSRKAKKVQGCDPPMPVNPIAVDGRVEGKGRVSKPSSDSYHC